MTQAIITRPLFLNVGRRWSAEVCEATARRAVEEQARGVTVVVYGEGLDAPGAREALEAAIARLGGEATVGDPEPRGLGGGA